MMEALSDKLKDLETPYLIEVVLNYRGYGYPEEAKDIALSILKERKINTYELELQVAHMVTISQEVHYFISRIDDLNRLRKWLIRIAFAAGGFLIFLALIFVAFGLEKYLYFLEDVIGEQTGRWGVTIAILAAFVATLLLISFLFVKIRTMTDEILDIIYKDIEHKRPESMHGIDIQEEIEKFKSIHSEIYDTSNSSK